ncbi:hypothetical protein CEP52_009276 [Fusarium oligoseptatum]|uniref:6-phosphogluconate dehydrogenase n=1 Tax=Fusarium oligoseptatum TaxID=2604345 RepID=A0A428TDZ6_9HYPO|nr:hypothetical protein CEP52_009276 [Fusarium oligoseptatum]
MSNNDSPIAKIGLLSIGDMGAGIANLLVAHNFAVATNCSGRSQDTIDRARKANVELLDTDVDLVEECSVILSVVPPRDAEDTARRVVDALSKSKRREALYFVDLNAVSPSSTKAIGALLEKSEVPVRFIDGCILGGPPKRTTSTEARSKSSSNSDYSDWIRPRLPISGPEFLSTLPYGGTLASVLNMNLISPDIGAASGLKMCFAAMSKGFIAIATQSFTTAHSLGVADVLRDEMTKGLPTHLALADKAVPNMPPKAYRWVREMEEIADTMGEEGGWGKELFQGAAGVYKDIAEDEVLGNEKVGKRKMGTTLDDVAAAASEGLQKKRRSGKE